MKNLFKILALTTINSFMQAQSALTFTVTSNTGSFILGCNAQSLNLTASTNYSLAPVNYIWSGTNTVITGNTITVNNSGSYTVTAIATNSQTATQVITISGNPALAAPAYSVVSPQNFTLGCTTKSVAVINIINASTNPPGGPVSYTLLAPSASSVLPSGSLSTMSIYSVSIPGVWTVIVRDNTNLCETRTPVSILQNTFAPSLNVSVPTQILDCNVGHVTLYSSSSTLNTSTTWSYPGIPGIFQGDSLSVNANSTIPTSTLIANYTLTITDNSSTCKSTSVIPMYQNFFKPKALISNGGNATLTCVTPTIMLTNTSITNIPPSAFPTNQPVVGYLWEGPTPQAPLSLSSVYVGSTAGVYTLTVKDLNNGCISSTTTILYGGCSTVGIQKNSAAGLSISTFPNPNNGLFEIVSEDITDVSNIEIYNISGQLVKKQNISSGRTSVNMTNEANGVYFVHVKQNDALIYSIRIIKE